MPPCLAEEGAQQVLSSSFLPSFSREEEKALLTSPSSLEKEGSLPLDLALLQIGEDRLAIRLPLLEKKKLPFPSSWLFERRGESLALSPLVPYLLERKRWPCLLPSSST